MPLHLILGGARSGKSGHAEQLALAAAGPVTYIATARAGDAEMAARIAHHRQRRPSAWATAEAPVHLAAALRQAAAPGAVVLVDCLTLWLNNLLFDPPLFDPPPFDPPPFDPAPELPADGLPTPPARLVEERAALLACLPGLPGLVIVVSNEIGCGVVPMGAQTRFFVDQMGRLNQDVAALADRVTLTIAGLPLALKG